LNSTSLSGQTCKYAQTEWHHHHRRFEVSNFSASLYLAHNLLGFMENIAVNKKERSTRLPHEVLKFIAIIF
jgi:hypothetical protein